MPAVVGAQEEFVGLAAGLALVRLLILDADPIVRLAARVEHCRLPDRVPPSHLAVRLLHNKLVGVLAGR